MFYVPSFTDFSVPLGEKWKKKRIKRKTKKNMKRNESQRKTNTKNKEKENKGPKPPETAQKLIFDVRAQEFKIEFLKFVGFLYNFEISHAIGTSATAIERSFSLDLILRLLHIWHVVVADSWRNALLATRKKTHPLVSSRRASEHQCLSEAKIPSLWHNFNISGCTYGCTFTSILVSAWDPRSSTVVLLCLLLLFL